MPFVAKGILVTWKLEPRYTFLLYPYRLQASSNMHFRSIAGALPPIPDHLSIPQFFLDTQHAMRPERPLDAPWLVADKSGRAFGLDEIQARTNGLAVSLRDKYAIGRNNAVLFFTSNHIDYPICMWAVHRLLGIVTPCNPALTVPELVNTIKLSKAALIISHADNLDVVSAAAKQTKIPTSRIIVLEDQDAHNPFKSKYGPYTTVESLVHDGSQLGEKIKEIRFRQGEAKEQVAFYSSSSGTTGPPKMVKISHFAFIADILISAVLNKVGESSPRFVPGDRCLGVLPFYHIYGLNLILHFNFFAGITVIVIPKFNFPDMLKSIERYKINSLMVVPPQVVLLTKEPIVKKYDLSHVRVVVCAAAPLASELYDQLINLLPQAYIGQAYGSTEATGVVSMSSIHEKHGRHGGILAPGVEGRVVRHDGTLVGYDGEGELHIRTPAAAMGYLDNEDATRETFLHDSWIRTGDLVKIDKNEEIIVLDRVKEMIKVRGFQVAPAELEGCILDHPLVADVCVVGVPHPFNGEVPFAFVTLTEEGFKVSQSDLKASINKRVAENKAPFKHLHHIEVIDSIPKTPSGKLLRRDLREKARGLTVTVRTAKL